MITYLCSASVFHVRSVGGFVQFVHTCSICDHAWYPLQRPAGAKAGIVKDIIKYLLSSNGSSIITATSFTGITERLRHIGAQAAYMVKTPAYTLTNLPAPVEPGAHRIVWAMNHSKLVARALYRSTHHKQSKSTVSEWTIFLVLQ